MNVWIYVLMFGLLAALAFFMSPPTRLVDKFAEKFALHPKLEEERATRVTIQGLELHGADKAQFIHDFNQVDFLSHGGFDPQQSGEPIRVCIDQGKNVFRFTMYLCNERDQIGMIKHKERENIPYRVLGPDLTKFLQVMKKAV